MKKFNEFSISAFVATVPEVKEFEEEAQLLVSAFQ